MCQKFYLILFLNGLKNISESLMILIKLRYAYQNITIIICL